MSGMVCVWAPGPQGRCPIASLSGPLTPGELGYEGTSLSSPNAPHELSGFEPGPMTGERCALSGAQFYSHFPLASTANLAEDAPKIMGDSSTMHSWAKPGPFIKLSQTLLPWLKLGCVVLFGGGLAYALVLSPPDYQQGEVMRIMYVHVPASWMALGVYTFVALMSLFALVWRHPLAELLAMAAAPIGALFTVISLVTGSLWGKPMWGAWWVWDARLTSVVILLFLYLGYMALVRAFDDPAKGLRAGSVLALVGWINIPIIKFSVEWWNTLHQPASLTKFSAPSIHSSMLTPLLLMAGAYGLYFLVALTLRVKIEHIRRKALVQQRGA